MPAALLVEPRSARVADRACEPRRLHTARGEPSLRVGFKPVPKGRVTMPGPVDAGRVLVFELVDGAFEGVSGPVGPDWSKARG